jgi:methyl-accepting chemotaxis protein
MQEITMPSSEQANTGRTTAGIIRRSLGTQILLLILGVTALSVGLTSVVGMLLGKQTMLESMAENGAQVGGLLQLAIEKPMRSGDDATTAHEFTVLAEKFPSAYISIASFNGSVTYATKAADVRKHIDALYDVRLTALHKRALQGQAAAGQLLTIEDKANYVQVTPILNEPACYHCHGKSQKVLGAMLVRQDVTPQVERMTRNTLANVLVSLAGCLVLACIILYFIRRRVSMRVHSLAITSDSIIAGDFNARFTVRGGDELGQLARNLGIMLDNLKNLGIAQSVLHGMSIPCVMCNTNAQLTFINKNLLDLLEIEASAEDMAGKDVHTLFFFA